MRALVRNPDKPSAAREQLEVYEGSITDYSEMDELVQGVDFVVALLGDARSQTKNKINTAFVKMLVPAMRRQGVRRFLDQAGGLSKLYKDRLPFILWVLRNTVARSGGLVGQHEDNEAVIACLVEEARDVEWIVHRASIISDGPSKGILERSKTKIGLATFRDCAAYNYQLLQDISAMHTYDPSYHPR